jgi:hypothetical protein
MGKACDAGSNPARGTFFIEPNEQDLVRFRGKKAYKPISIFSPGFISKTWFEPSHGAARKGLYTLQLAGHATSNCMRAKGFYNLQAESGDSAQESDLDEIERGFL